MSAPVSRSAAFACAASLGFLVGRLESDLRHFNAKLIDLTTQLRDLTADLDNGPVQHCAEGCRS